MSGDTRAAQAARIIHTLATLDGGRSIDLVERKYARVGPAEPGTSYEESTRTIAVATAEAAARDDLSDDADDLVIRLRGALPDVAVPDVLARFIDATDLDPGWDLRASAAGGEFELTVFTTALSTPGDA